MEQKLRELVKFEDLKEELLGEGCSTFLYTTGYPKTLFVQIPVGTGKYVYSRKLYTEEREGFLRRIAETDEDFTFEAVIADGKAYVAGYAFQWLPMESDRQLPEGFTKLSAYRDQLGQTLRMHILDGKFAVLAAPGELPGDREKSAQRTARAILIGDTTYDDVFQGIVRCSFNELSQQDVCEHLIGLRNLEEEMDQDFDCSIEAWSTRKAYLAKIQEYTGNPGTVLQPYEKKLAKAVQEAKGMNPEPKFLIVTFSRDGKEAVGKVGLLTLQKTLANQDYFSTFDFQTTKMGEGVYQSLGIDTRMGWEYRLTAKYISKITYKGKTLYEKEES